ncbi:hypothetical protein [uncultured Thiohalocapsa sp.]|uniref:hypothetical protein n=1 Tax=uncultured Thiohalocapsa sp. TaxID=768990 RepID=UPI0025ED2AC7|nr:hypothetical protein [uncultured Thiohalocapsa sp.]
MSITLSGASTGPSSLDRRRFIAAALAFTAGALGWRGAGADAAATDIATDARADAGAAALLGPVSAPAAAARIGSAYLAAQPQAASPDQLVRELSRALLAATGSVPSTTEAMLTALTRLIAAEYCTGPLVRADGWLLAPSEARLYALAALARAVETTPNR